MQLLFVFIASLALIAATLIFYMIAMPGKSYGGSPNGQLDETLKRHIEEHVRYLAETIGERHYQQSGSLENTARYIEQQFVESGYAVQRQPYTLNQQTFYNLQVETKGIEKPEEILVVGAHYDTVFGSPGADDNASGIAALIELARLFRDKTTNRSVRFVAFVNEEKPLGVIRSGAMVYAHKAKERGENIVGMISLESIGYYDNTPGSQRYPRPLSWFYPDTGSFIAFIGNLSSRKLVRDAIRSFREYTQFPSQGVAAPERLVPDISRSDHAPFWRQGYSGIMITDTVPVRNPNYHRASDTPDTLNFDYMAISVAGLSKMLADLAK